MVLMQQKPPEQIFLIQPYLLLLTPHVVMHKSNLDSHVSPNTRTNELLCLWMKPCSHYRYNFLVWICCHSHHRPDGFVTGVKKSIFYFLFHSQFPSEKIRPQIMHFYAVVKTVSHCSPNASLKHISLKRFTLPLGAFSPLLSIKSLRNRWWKLSAVWSDCIAQQWLKCGTKGLNYDKIKS